MNILYELLESQSSQNPGQLGLACSAQQLTFSELKLAVDCAAVQLTELGISRGLIVATNLEAYESWILALAIAKVGAIGLTLAPGQSLEGEGSPLWHFLITNNPAADSAHNRLVFDKNWFSFDQSPATSPASFAPNEWVRAISTSGTTGEPKVALFDHRSLSNKAQDITKIWSGDRTEFNFMGLGSTGGFSTALASLLTGKPYLAKDTRKRPLIDFMVANQVEVLSGSPDQIAGFMSANMVDLPLLSGIKTIRLAGSNPGKVFLEKLRSHFDADIQSVYGSTETGAIFSSSITDTNDPKKLGDIRAGCEARVVDSSRSVISDGSIGFLETKSPSMYSGYLVSATAMSTQPSGDWFETGDMVSSKGGLFEFFGRDSNVLNVGGMKFDVSELEDFVKGIPGVSDALCFTGEDKQGREIHVMALVAQDSQISQKVLEAVNRRFTRKAPQLIWSTPMIQRVGLDKPARWKTREDFYKDYLGR
jgi:acyl-coenzyme A synthetase/AMP-(fatty) acid ligase